MIQYSRKNLKPLVRREIEKRGQEFDSFNEIVEKAVKAEKKAPHRSRSYICNTDQYCVERNCSAATRLHL